MILFIGRWLCLVLVLSACSSVNKEKITIAAAANMQFAMEDLTKAFTAKSGLACELIISSSGKLTAQIKEGAPYDVFVSANMKYPEEIHKSGLAVQAPQIYAYGKLVLWTMFEDIETSLETLQKKQIKHIAIANPKTAPYGAAAVEVLENAGVYEEIKSKLVYGESITQTNRFIVSKAAEIGFTAMSVVQSPKMKGQGNWIELDDKTYSPIEQGVVLIKRKKTNVAHAQQFYDFLFSPEGQKILSRFGYSILITND